MDWENLPYAEKKRLRSALAVLAPVVFAPVVLIVAVLLYIQVFQAVNFRRRAEENRTQTIIRLAPRGLVYDCTGRIIADNRPCVKAFYYPFEAQESRHTEEMYDLFPDMGPTLDAAVRSKRVSALCDEMTREQLFRVVALRHRIPGISVATEYRRRYPDGLLFAHALGYVSAITAQEFRTLKTRNYHIQDYSGKTGVERVYEQYLRGTNGAVVTEIDAKGVAQRVIRDVEPVPGHEVHTTLDTRLQYAARAMLASSGYHGAVVGVDPRNGAVRVLVSYPDFDPNGFVATVVQGGGRTPGDVSSKPEFNRAIMGAYAPGSIVKPVFLLAGLQEERTAPGRQVECLGGMQVGNRFFHCWHRAGHGMLSAVDALRESCDVFFYQLGLSLGPDGLERWIRMFGAGNRTGIDLPFEVSGSCHGRRWKQARMKIPWFDGDTANLSIGQGYLSMSVIQMAVMTAALANRGTLWRPFVVDRVVDRHGEVVLRNSGERIGVIKAEDRHWQVVEQAMVGVIERGTGMAARVPGAVLAGKTGTAQNPHGPDHALFICYGPIIAGEVPKLALAVMVEHGLRGGGIAARISNGVFRTLVDETYQADRVLPKDPVGGVYGD